MKIKKLCVVAVNLVLWSVALLGVVRLAQNWGQTTIDTKGCKHTAYGYLEVIECKQ